MNPYPNNGFYGNSINNGINYPNNNNININYLGNINSVNNNSNQGFNNSFNYNANNPYNKINNSKVSNGQGNKNNFGASAFDSKENTSWTKNKIYINAQNIDIKPTFFCRGNGGSGEVDVGNFSG